MCIVNGAWLRSHRGACRAVPRFRAAVSDVVKSPLCAQQLLM